MIYFQDHINSEEKNSNENTNFVNDNQFSSESSDLIDFPTKPVEDISKEEIGKWVDQLMEMPDSEDEQTLIDAPVNEWEDPFSIVAERILSEEGI